MAAAAWSCVEKMLQEVQVSSAPRALRVSMRTAVWMAARGQHVFHSTYNTKGSVLMCRHPAMRAPFNGWSAAYFSRVIIRPGISFSASSISRRPKAARLMSATFILCAGADMVAVVMCMVEKEGMGRMEQERGRPERLRARRLFNAFPYPTIAVSGPRRRVLTRGLLGLHFTARSARGHATPRVICRVLRR
jgi:hypothetical protein